MNHGKRAFAVRVITVLLSLQMSESYNMTRTLQVHTFSNMANILVDHNIWHYKLGYLTCNIF